MPPIAFIISVTAWIRGANRPAAIAGTAISALELLGFFWITYLQLCR